MKTHLLLFGAVSLLGTSFFTTSDAAEISEFLHFTRHRDSNGNLLMGPTQHQAEASVMQKTVMPAQPKTFERRSTDWGMSVQEVKQNEPVPTSWELQTPVLKDGEQRVAYHTQIEGIDAALTYTFYQDQLSQAKYVFEPQHEDAAEYLKDFHAVEGWISKSYGAPRAVKEIWLDTLYQYDKSLWGQAIRRGHLTMVAEWQRPGTDIVLVLDGGNDEIGLVADFASTTFVVPVTFDTKSAEENIGEVMESTTKEEVLPMEPSAAPSQDHGVGQDMTHETQESGETHPETEVASQKPVSELNELEEIEQMLNEDYPPIESSVEPAGKVDTMNHSVDGTVQPEAAIEPMENVEAPQQIIEASENMPSEPSIEEPSVEPDTTDHHADDHAMEEPTQDNPAMEEPIHEDQAMEAGEELAPQHL